MCSRPVEKNCFSIRRTLYEFELRLGEYLKIRFLLGIEGQIVNTLMMTSEIPFKV